MIELKNVTKTYAEGNQSLTDVSLKIGKGEFVFIVGGSGSGKTTLLKLLIAEDKPSEGSIRVADQTIESIKRRQIPEYRRKLGIVFRDFRLFPGKTVYENVAFALRVTGEPTGTIRAKVMTSLQMVELSDKVKCYPADLSGCEQQRVALARALAGGPNIVIADEPCGNIDPMESRDLLELFGRIQSRYEKTVVVLTYDRELAESFDHRIIRLHRGQIVDDRAANLPEDLSEVTEPDSEETLTEESAMELLPEIAPAVEDVLPEVVIPEIAPVMEEALTVVVDENPTMEYDLADLIATGEMDAHTANDLVAAAKQILGLSESEASGEPAEASEQEDTVEPVEVADQDEIEESAEASEVVEQEEADESVASHSEPADEPTVVIPVIDPTAIESAKEGNN